MHRLHRADKIAFVDIAKSNLSTALFLRDVCFKGGLALSLTAKDHRIDPVKRSKLFHGLISLHNIVSTGLIKGGGCS